VKGGDVQRWEEGDDGDYDDDRWVGVTWSCWQQQHSAGSQQVWYVQVNTQDSTGARQLVRQVQGQGTSIWVGDIHSNLHTLKLKKKSFVMQNCIMCKKFKIKSKK